MTPERKREYDRAYMKMAYAFAQLSQAERSKVGCLIVSKNGQIISQGFNGMPKGMDNCCENCSEHGLTTKREVLHAETNAILKCAKDGGRTEGCTLYITLSPCFDCAKIIIQAGISKVYYAEKYRDMSGTDLLEECGVETEYLPLEQSDLYYIVNYENKPCIKMDNYVWEMKDNFVINPMSFGEIIFGDKPIKINR